MIVFSNPGEIDPRLITTLGLNVKPATDAPIGHFGTGLKYAIAVLLREKQQVTIQSSSRLYSFIGVEQEVRGKDFTFIHMICGHEITKLGFTTDLGKNWSLREAYRELHCNSLDEGGLGGQLDSACAKHLRKLEVGDPAQPRSTHVLVGGAEFEAVHHARDEFILPIALRTLLHTTPSVDVYAGRTRSVFYRSIRVFQVKDNVPEFAHTYNIKAQMQLTEDRTAWSWEVDMHIRHALAQSPAPYHVVADALARDTYEQEEVSFAHAPADPQFFVSIRQLMRERPLALSKSALARYYAGDGAEPNYEHYTLTPHEAEMLNVAADLLESAGFHVRAWPLHVVHSLGENVLALAQGGKIYLTPQVFPMGCLAETMLEEYVHLAHQVRDCSRDMQNALIEHITRLARILALVRDPLLVEDRSTIRGDGEVEVDDSVPAGVSFAFGEEWQHGVPRS